MSIDDKIQQLFDQHKDGVAHCIEAIVDRAGTSDADWQVLLAAGELLDELAGRAARVCQSYRSSMLSLEHVADERDELHALASRYNIRLSDLRRKGINITGGIDSAEYVRQMRGGD